MTLPPRPAWSGLVARFDGDRFAALLDLDGTLAPIAPRPADAAVPEETRRIVAALSSLPDSLVVAVSGRGADDAARLLGVPNAWVIGNHGFETKPPGAPSQPLRGAEEFRDAVEEAAREASEVARKHAGVIVENKRWTLSVHYRLAREADVPAVVAAIHAIAAERGLRAMPGKRIVEVRPPLDVDKGVASVALLRERGFIDDVSMICAGDDRTDEDMFAAVRRAVPQAVTIRILGEDDASPDGYRGSAEFGAPNPNTLRDLLCEILKYRRGRPSRGG